MRDIDDPFREGLPDFGDTRWNEYRDDIVAGTELMRALVGTVSLEELFRGVEALTEEDARRALPVTLVALRHQLGDRSL